MTTWVSLKSRGDRLERGDEQTSSAGMTVHGAEPCSAAEVRKRPGAARRERLLATEEGRGFYVVARRWIASGLVAHEVAPLSALRLRKGLSQAELAERSGILQPQISRIENGKHPDIDLGTAAALAAALGESLDSFNAAFNATIAARNAR